MQGVSSGSCSFRYNFADSHPVAETQLAGLHARCSPSSAGCRRSWCRITAQTRVEPRAARLPQPGHQRPAKSRAPGRATLKRLARWCGRGHSRSRATPGQGPEGWRGRWLKRWITRALRTRQVFSRRTQRAIAVLAGSDSNSRPFPHNCRASGNRPSDSLITRRCGPLRSSPMSYAEWEGRRGCTYDYHV